MNNRLGTFIARYYNLIQFIGYVPSSLVLAVRNGMHGCEGMAAALFLLAALLIALFDPLKRPSMLLYGGLATAAGGFLLVAAGYPLTGFAVALSSLETARGGLKELRA